MTPAKFRFMWGTQKKNVTMWGFWWGRRVFVGVTTLTDPIDADKFEGSV